MINHQYVNFNYPANDIANILDYNPAIYCRGCSISEKKKINQILTLPFPIHSVLYFVLNPKAMSIIHKDIDLDNPLINPDFALNLPLLNCEMTYMKWYEVLDENNTQEFGGPSAGARTPMIKFENSKCIDESHFLYPQIVKIDDWHSIENWSETESVLISIRFKKYIQLDTVNQFFMPQKKGDVPL